LLKEQDQQDYQMTSKSTKLSAAKHFTTRPLNKSEKAKNKYWFSVFY